MTAVIFLMIKTVLVLTRGEPSFLSLNEAISQENVLSIIIT